MYIETQEDNIAQGIVLEELTASGAADRVRKNEIQKLIAGARLIQPIIIYDSVRHLSAGAQREVTFFSSGKGKEDDVVDLSSKKTWRTTNVLDDGHVNDGEILMLFSCFKTYPRSAGFVGNDLVATRANRNQMFNKSVEAFEAGSGAGGAGLQGNCPTVEIIIGQDQIFGRYLLEHIPFYWTHAAELSAEHATNTLKFGKSGALLLDSRTKLSVLQKNMTANWQPPSFTTGGGLADVIQQFCFQGVKITPLVWNSDVAQRVGNLTSLN